MKLCVLGSGSKGNAYYVEAGETRVLFDAGFSALELKKRLASIGVEIESLTAIVISHEHTDHIQGLRVLGRKLPVYATAGTLKAVRKRYELNGTETIAPGDRCAIGTISFRAVPLSHDAADPVGFVIDDGEKKIGILTDQGALTRLLPDRLKELDVAVIEANHDPDMLINGPYAWELKQRIKGRRGHLSNREAAELVSGILHAGLRHVLLAHLSETNNQPSLALCEVRKAVDGHPASLEALRQDRPACMIRL